MRNVIEISIDEYRNLLRRDLILTMLENAGVDNWEWYGEHLTPLREEYPDIEDIDDIIEMIIDERLEEAYENEENLK